MHCTHASGEASPFNARLPCWPSIRPGAYIARMYRGSAVRSAAYNARERSSPIATGTLYYFKHRDAPEHHACSARTAPSRGLPDSAVLVDARRRREAQ